MIVNPGASSSITFGYGRKAANISPAKLHPELQISKAASNLARPRTYRLSRAA